MDLSVNPGDERRFHWRAASAKGAQQQMDAGEKKFVTQQSNCEYRVTLLHPPPPHSLSSSSAGRPGSLQPGQQASRCRCQPSTSNQEPKTCSPPQRWFQLHFLQIFFHFHVFCFLKMYFLLYIKDCLVQNLLSYECANKTKALDVGSDSFIMPQ